MNNADTRLQRLLTYLQADPDNTALLVDAVGAALDAGALDQAGSLNVRLADLAPDAFEPQYFAGLFAMRRADFAEAARVFEQLLVEHDDYPNLRFNLAWSRAMLGEKVAALALLDTPTVDGIAAAAMLRVQLLHEAAAFEEALAFGRAMLVVHPEDRGLLAAMATLALDVEDLDLARSCAAGGGDHPEALAATGLLDLQDGDAAMARRRFDRSLAAREHNPRAWIGRGMVALAEHDAASAARDMDRGAQQFGDHIGSWIAAGWAHLLAGDLAAAQQRFERALGIDPAFAESQGSLAVTAALRGESENARRRAAAALRLDRECFSAALAHVLLLNNDPRGAAQILDQALSTPLNPRGMTIASFMASLTRPTLH